MSQLSLDDFLKEEPCLEKTSQKPAAKNKKINSKQPSTSQSVALQPVAAQQDVAALLSQGEDVEFPEQQKEDTVYTVSDLSRAIKNQLEGEFPLVWLKGEISNFKPHSSGHFYFTLKDSKSQISAVMFKGFNRHVQFKPEDGMEILVRGKLTVYEPRGSYQIFCEVMEPVGLGALQIAFEQLKKKLQAEGLFDRAKKRPIPKFPSKVALVTSPTGAAIRDMLNVLGRRMKTLDITIFPCAVQGTSAVKEVVKAIQAANAMGGFDVMIVGRGGGSIEDMWCFNEELVARAIAASQIPTVSAVGHEIDFTIADFVADLRAPTPSAAAELISQNAQDTLDKIQVQFKNLRFAIYKKLQNEKQKIDFLSRKLVDPRRKLQDLSMRCDELQERLLLSAQRYVESRQMRLKVLSSKLVSPQIAIQLARKNLIQLSRTLLFTMQKKIALKREVFGKRAAALDSMSPLKVLDRGYSIVQNKKDKVIKQSADVQVGETIEVRLHQGHIEAQVLRIK